MNHIGDRIIEAINAKHKSKAARKRAVLLATQVYHDLVNLTAHADFMSRIFDDAAMCYVDGMRRSKEDLDELHIRCPHDAVENEYRADDKTHTPRCMVCRKWLVGKGGAA